VRTRSEPMGLAGLRLVVAAWLATTCLCFTQPGQRGPRAAAMHRHGDKSRSRVVTSLAPNFNSIYDPATFVPICAASDAFYRSAQGGVQLVVGPEVYNEYAPLIAGGLLRIRLELCVVESFVSEAVLPFVEKNGVSWVLPAHETVETFLAGTIFALASNFILIGSTKIVSVIVTYIDFFVGWPTRFIGSLGPKKDDKDDSQADPSVPVVIFFGGLAVVGKTSELARQVTEFADIFVRNDSSYPRPPQACPRSGGTSRS